MKQNVLKIIFGILFTAIAHIAWSQQHFNFSFEEPIAKPWFRLGDSTVFRNSIDQDIYYAGKGSLRVESLKKSNGFGGVMMMLPANLKGDSIRVSAMIKRENVTDSSSVSAMLRIDPKVYFDNMASRQIRGTKDWENFTVSAKLNPDITEGIALGFFLSGEGKIWIDDVTVTVDGKDITKETSMFVPFAKKVIDPIASGITDFNNSPEIDQRLVDLARIWGFLKYRHPTVGLGKLDWDNQLFKSINTVIMAKDNKAVEAHYEALLDSLGTTEDYPKPIVENMVHEVDYSWIDKLPFKEELKAKLKRIRYSSFEKHHYFGFADGIGNVLFQHEKKYENIRSADAGFRLLTLFRFWNMVEYFSPYKDLTEPNWSEVLKKSVPEMILSRDDKTYGLSILKLLSNVKDAHTGLWSRPKGLQSYYGMFRIPVEIRMVEGKAVVTKVFDTNHVDNMLKVGDVIVSKEHKKVEEIRDSVWAYIATPNVAVSNRELAGRLVASNSAVVPLQLLRDGQPMQLTISAVPMEKFRPKQTDTIAYKMLDNNILYIKHSLLRSKMIDENMADWSKVKGIVIDDRNYPGDFLVFKIGALILPKPTEFVRFSSTSFKYPGTFVMSSPLKVGEDTSDYYQGKIAVLVNEDTQSSAEYHVMGYQTAANVKIFGSQTAGADGNASFIDLPGNLRTVITGLGVYYPDFSETQRVGIRIDHTVNPTLKGVKDGIDEVLNSALEYLNK
ncbi:S41 family peptidase [Sphingobacterium faecium]|uniref:S41 family peptidase n=1 Tax=Sphingobacterium faecium TaxID=34087 RepID=UPI002468A7D3|nr:S41 family peptidase [Sphingobacterium faecium]MDH5826340.1 S41 family peptidase [Sphingobacterium faecium]